MENAGITLMASWRVAADKRHGRELWQGGGGSLAAFGSILISWSMTL